MSRCSSPTAMGSTPANGSSKRMYFGDESRLRATSARRRSPPESVSPSESATFSSRNSARSSSARALALRAPDAERLEDRREVLAHRELAEDRRLLRQVADAEPRAPVHRQPREVVRRRARPCPPSGVTSPTTMLKLGRLAGAVRAEQPDHLARARRGTRRRPPRGGRGSSSRALRRGAGTAVTASAPRRALASRRSRRASTSALRHRAPARALERASSAREVVDEPRRRGPRSRPVAQHRGALADDAARPRSRRSRARR